MSNPRPNQISRYEIGNGRAYRHNIPSVSRLTVNMPSIVCTPTFVGVPKLRADIPKTTDNVAHKPLLDSGDRHHYEYVRGGAMMCFCTRCQFYRQRLLLKKTNARRVSKGKLPIGSNRFYQM